MRGNSSGKHWSKLQASVGVFGVILCMAAADGSWMKYVPQAERAKVNPFAGHAEDVAAGSKVFADHCAKCHGEDAEGRRKRPSLRTGRVQGATDGELFWLLSNGSLNRGMPTWSKLPEPTRWQVVAYVKSLGTSWVQSEERNGTSESGGAAFWRHEASGKAWESKNWPLQQRYETKVQPTR